MVVRAAPEQGKANAEIEELLAEFFGVSRKQVSLVAGHASRRKRVQILGIDAQAGMAKVLSSGS